MYKGGKSCQVESGANFCIQGNKMRNTSAYDMYVEDFSIEPLEGKISINKYMNNLDNLKALKISKTQNVESAINVDDKKAVDMEEIVDNSFEGQKVFDFFFEILGSELMYRYTVKLSKNAELTYYRLMKIVIEAVVEIRDLEEQDREWFIREVNYALNLEDSDEDSDDGTKKKKRKNKNNYQFSVYVCGYYDGHCGEFIGA